MLTTQATVLHSLNNSSGQSPPLPDQLLRLCVSSLLSPGLDTWVNHIGCSRSGRWLIAVAMAKPKQWLITVTAEKSSQWFITVEIAKSSMATSFLNSASIQTSVHTCVYTCACLVSRPGPWHLCTPSLHILPHVILSTLFSSTFYPSKLFFSRICNIINLSFNCRGFMREPWVFQSVYLSQSH